MRVLFTFFLFIVFKLSGLSLDGDPKLLFSVNSQNKARIGILNYSDKDVKLVIENSAFVTLYKKSVGAGQNIFEFYDLSGLPDGRYVVKATNSKYEEVIYFTVTSGLVKVNRIDDVKPGFMLIGKEYLVVKYQNLNAFPVKIQIRDKGTLLFEDVCSEEQILKKYSLKELIPGDYEAVLSIGGKEFSYKFTIN